MAESPDNLRATVVEAAPADLGGLDHPDLAAVVAMGIAIHAS